MRFHKVLFVLSGAVLMGVSVGCSTGTSGKALGEGHPDPCDLLHVDELISGGYLDTDLPVSMTKRIGDSQFHDAGMATCAFGTFEKTGVTLSFPLGAPESSVADLVGGRRAIAVKIPGAQAFITDSAGHDSEIAVQKGDSQFVIGWDPIEYRRKTDVTADRLRLLAERVSGRILDKITVPPADIPVECDKATASAKALVGDITVSRGSSDADNLYCDYAGAGGVVRAAARFDEPKDLSIHKKVIRDGMGSPADVAPGVVATATRIGSMLTVDSVLDGCCRVNVEFLSRKSRTDQPDGKEAAFTRSFFECARTWA